MSSNPLFPKNQDDTSATSSSLADAAVELIRSKVARAYAGEPDVSEELAEIKHERVLSKHQRYMQELSSSGKSLAEIQTAWHHYYTLLPDNEKHEVWQEFYAANQRTPYQKLFQKQHIAATEPQPTVALTTVPTSLPQVIPQTMGQTLPSLPPQQQHKPKAAYKSLLPNNPTVHRLKHKIVDKVSAGGRLKPKHHLQSLLFGLGTGAIVLAVLLFSFFNQYIIAPFIQPSRNVSATPIILGDSSSLDTSVPQVIIPKINVQIPLDFNVQTNDENAIETALEGGVVHYPSTVHPGENGNAAFFGHSSNNIFNPGKYKFAFVLLHTLTTGDIFYITYNGQAYAYRVIAREVVPPSQVSVLNDTKGKTATAALITCDPPGTSNNRLVVWGEQISPAIGSNTTAAQAPATDTKPAQLADNGPSLWNRFTDALSFWN